MAQQKSYTMGKKDSLNATTMVKALTSLHKDHWFKMEVCIFVLSLFLAHFNLVTAFRCASEID